MFAFCPESRERRYPPHDEEYGPGGVPAAELAIALLRAIGGSERIAVEKLRDLCQYWLDTGTWPDEA